MELTFAERKAVTKAIAIRCARLDKAGKSRVLDELCATTGWHRNHVRKALKHALRPRIVKARRPRPPKYGPKVAAALTTTPRRRACRRPGHHQSAPGRSS